MSKVKRILSVIMAMVMVLAMSVPTFAAEKSATIKVTGLDKDATVTYKQIIEPDDTTATGWKFTDPNDAKAFDKNLDEQMIIWKMKSGSTKMTNEPDNVKAYSAQEFANAIAKITTSTPVKDANDQLQRAGEAGEISWTVNKAGVYVVNATSDYKVGNKVKYTYSTMAGYVSFDNYDKETGLPETLNNATITAKSSSIDITKKNNEKDGVVEVGKVVEYTVETKIPYVNDANPIKRFEVTDVIRGAEYVTNQEGKLVLKVTVGTGAETEELVDVNNNSFTLDLTSYLANNDHANQSVVIKYSAKVTGTVVNNTVEWNNGKNESQTATDTLYTGTVTLTKTGENGAKLENAEFVRYGVMHRNSYMDSPNLLKQTFQSKSNPNLFFAGQMTGVEGYVESAASGLVAGINAARLFKGEEELIFPHTTAIGSLPYYVTHAESKHFQPMNVNFGIIKELEGPRIRDKKERYEKIAERALKDLQPFIQA